MGESRRFWTGSLIVLCPALLLFLPLLGTTLDPPYVASLVLGGLAVVGVSAGAGWACARRGSHLPSLCLVFAVAILLVTAAVAEVLLTLRLRGEDAFAAYRAWGHRRSILMGFEATPNHTWTAMNATYTTDGHGFRTHVGDAAWETKTGMRIFTLGESSVFGYGLDDDQTWPHLLEAQLRAKLGTPALTVINAGNNGYTSLQTLFRFYTKVLPLHPTHVILYLGPNDVWIAGDPERLLITEDIVFSRSVVEYWAYESKGRNPYARTLLFYVLVKRVLPTLPKLGRRASAVLSPGTPAWAAESDLARSQRERERVGETYLRNVRTICLISRANGVTPILATFLHNLADDQRAMSATLRRNNELLRQLAADERIALVDLEHALDGMPDRATYFDGDGYHPSRRGAEFIAETIAAAWHGDMRL